LYFWFWPQWFRFSDAFVFAETIAIISELDFFFKKQKKANNGQRIFKILEVKAIFLFSTVKLVQCNAKNLLTII